MVEANKSLQFKNFRYERKHKRKLKETQINIFDKQEK